MALPLGADGSGLLTIQRGYSGTLRLAGSTNLKSAFVIGGKATRKSVRDVAFDPGVGMLLDLYLWLWPQMGVRYLLKRFGYLFGLALLLIGPLLYVNVELIRQGFKPSRASLSIEADHGYQSTGFYDLATDE